ncbi:MAG: hypothetical protein P9L88_06580 [Candidatus Tantalella remota]|nr:hypothetical protein [Candidatus Tantalella remota]
MSKTFATAINCMDGRIQRPVIKFLLENYDVDYVDMITEMGPNKILAEGQEEDTIASFKKKVAVSVEKHGSTLIAVAAHHDCAGNPASDDIQKKQLLKSIKVVTSWGFPVKKIIALWLDEKFTPSVIS